MNHVSRRGFLQSTGVLAAAVAPPRENYDNHAKGIRILPGAWRPHYPWEHIAWVSPPWPSQDYIWLDFPEAIFTSQGLLFLSHVNPPIPTVFHDLPAVAWRRAADGVSFERKLPNGVRFGGSVRKQSEAVVALELHLRNGTREPLKRISLQTCAFLRAIREFADYTNTNKYVHLAKTGWLPLAGPIPEGASGPYRLGWRWSGKPVADLPVAVVVSNKGSKLMAMSWLSDTISMVGNPNHPCVHADPKFKDLEPGEAASIHGKLVFFEGNLEDFDFSKY
jgi:hypothetical protein